MAKGAPWEQRLFCFVFLQIEGMSHECDTQGKAMDENENKSFLRINVSQTFHEKQEVILLYCSGSVTFSIVVSYRHDCKNI